MNVHGGLHGAIYGAWDFIQSVSSNELMEKITLSYKRGNVFKDLYGKLSQDNTLKLNQAIATKYQTYLSRRKYDYICKIQSATFVPDKQQWITNCVSYGDLHLSIHNKPIS